MADLKIQYIPISNIILDPRNPRVAPALESIEGDPPQNFIELALGQFAPDDDERGVGARLKVPSDAH